MQVFMLIVVLMWISISRAASDIDLLYKAVHVVPLFLTLLILIGYQNVFGFWLTFSIGGIYALNEYPRRDVEPPFYTIFVQLVAIIIIVAHATFFFAYSFLPQLQHLLDVQFGFLYHLLKVRETIVVIVVSATIFATWPLTFKRLRTFEWKDFKAPRRLPLLLRELVETLLYFVGNFFRLIKLAFSTLMRESVIYLVQTFVSRAVWWPVVYVLASFAICAFIVATSFWVQPSLEVVLRNSRGFFAPNIAIIESYLMIGAAFAGVSAAVALLIWLGLWRLGEQAVRHAAYKAFTLASAGIFVCIWIASSAAWVVNLIFQIDPQQFVVLGYFTSIAIFFAIPATVNAFRAKLPATN